MPILAVVLVMALGFGVVLFLIKITLPRIFRNVLDHYGRRLELAEQIVNTRRAPLEWLRREMDQLKAATEPDRRQRIEARAVRISVKRLDSVISFLKNANIFDTPDTKRTVIRALISVREEWREHGWTRVEPDTDYVLLRDRPSEAESD